jgi:hypothetical protein
MTLEDSLDHFMKCFSREEQLHYWQYMREDGEVARRCLMQMHDRYLQEHREYIIVLRNKLDSYREQSLRED